jgi:hypothetical protein
MRRTLFTLAFGAALIALLAWLAVRSDDSRPSIGAVGAQTPPVADDPAAPVAERDTSSAPDASQPPPSPVPVRAIARVGSVAGRCVDAYGAPIAKVQVACDEPATSTASDVDGRFSLALDLLQESDSRRVTITLAARGRGTLAKSLVVELAHTEDLGDVVLFGAGGLVGRVVDEHGVPFAGAEVRCTNAEQEPRANKNFRGPRPFNVSTTTDALGLFRLENAPATWQRAWAGADGMLWDAGAPVRVVEGAETAEILLTLRPIAREDMISIAVVSPDGQPVPHARLLIQTTGTIFISADERGRYTHFTMNDLRAPAAIFASDPERRYRTAGIENVQPGTLDVVMRLLPPLSIDVHVVDAHEVPVERFTATCEPRDWRMRDRTAVPNDVEHADGRVSLSVPSATFDLVVDAPGFALAKLGPFEPDTTPASLRVVLTAVPGVRGIVTFHGAPVADAALSLHEAVGERQSLRVAGLPMRSQYDAIANATSDARGAFVLTVRERGSYWVRAVADGFAPIDVGPVGVDPAVGLDGVAIELARGGAIEGYAGAQPGESAEGAIVVASRGDGIPLSTRAAANGAYRFERLAPGAWWVERGKREIGPDHPPSELSTLVAPQAVREEFESNCNVLDGQVTHFDLPATDPDQVRLQGNFRVDGRPPGPWHVELRSHDEDGTREARLDDRGSFQLAGARAGSYTLALRSTEIGADVRVVIALELRAGANRWELDLATGRVEGRIRPETGGESIEWNHGLSNGSVVQGTVFVDADGRFVIANAPLGSLELRASSRLAAAPVTIEVANSATAPVEL